MKTITVNTNCRYNIHIGNNILSDSGNLISQIIGSKHLVIVTDDNVDKLYTSSVKSSLEQSGFLVDVFVFKNGEASKSHKTLIKLYDFLSQKQVTRKDTLIALGGGVVGDLTGYAAATYLRGMSFVQIPTTFLAQIDSSVGGKTGVNIKSGKNLVGAFLQPKLVICDPKTLDTLSEQIFNDGVAEAIKYGCIKSSTLFDKILNEDIHKNINDIIWQCVNIKREIVECDEFESGQRMLLNFGHTFGHAIEKTFNYSTYTHGQAVGIGMVTMTKLSEKHNHTKAGTADKISDCLKKYNMPVSADIPAKTLFKNSINDKKRAGDQINIILIKEICKSYIHKLSITDFEKFCLGDNK